MIINKSDIKSASLTADFLKQGKIVILPTDTVYGFSGIVDANDDSTFSCDEKIRAIKGRSETKPLIQLIAKPEDIYLYTDDKIPTELLQKWPGALTIIVNVKKNAPLSENAKLPTIAFRCPGDVWLRKIISLCNAPLYSTSVNRSGSPVLENENDIISEFEDEVDLIVTDGDKKGALPSTLVKIENGEGKILRQGSVKI